MRSYKPMSIGKKALCYLSLGIASLIGCYTNSFQPNYGTQGSVVASSEGYSGSFRKDNVSLTAHIDENENLEGKLEVTENYNDFHYKAFSFEGNVSAEDGQIKSDEKYKVEGSLRLDDGDIGSGTDTAYILKVNGSKDYTETLTQGSSSSLDTSTEITGMGVGLDVITDNNWRANINYTQESKTTEENVIVTGNVVDSQKFETDINTITASAEFNTRGRGSDIDGTYGFTVNHNFGEEENVKPTTEGNLRGTWFLNDNNALSGTVNVNDSNNSAMVMLSRTSGDLKVNRGINDIRDFLVSEGNLKDKIDFASSTYFDDEKLNAREGANIWHLFYRVDEDSRELGLIGEYVFTGNDTKSCKFAVDGGIILTDNKNEDDEITGFVGVKLVK